MVSLIASLFEDLTVLLSLLGGASLLMFVGSLIAVPLVIIRLPKDYLRREHKLVRDWPRHLFLPFMVLKNVEWRAGGQPVARHVTQARTSTL